MRTSQPFSHIRLLRAARGLAQADLAAAAGVSAAAISNLEVGRRPARRDLLEAIALALDCPVRAVTAGDFTVTARSGQVEVRSQG